MVPLHAMMPSNAPRQIFVKSWAASTCYGQVDWFAIVPRELTKSYFTIVPEATCQWAEETKTKVRQRDFHVARSCPTLNERTLIEWVRDRGGGGVRSAHAREQVIQACHLRARCGKGTPNWCARAPGRRLSEHVSEIGQS